MSGGVPKRISISRTQRNTYCKAGGKDKVQGLVLCSGARSRRATCNYVMKRTNIRFSEIDIKGGVISKDGGDIIHTFDTPGTYIFSIDTIGSDYVGQGLEFDTLILGGGGGGGGANAGKSDVVGPPPIPMAVAGGGGGGGQFIENSGTIIIQKNMKYQVIVGDGGPGGSSGGNQFGGVALGGEEGGISSFFGIVANGAKGGGPGLNLPPNQFGDGGDTFLGSGGNHSNATFRYGGGGGGAGSGANGGNATFDATSVPMDTSGGFGGFSPTNGTSSITGTSTKYGGGGGGGIVWFSVPLVPPHTNLGGGKGGEGGHYFTKPTNSFNPTGGNSTYYGYGSGVGSIADPGIRLISGYLYPVVSILFNASLNSFSLCLEGSPPLLVNSFTSISFVSNVPGSTPHTYFTANASFFSFGPTVWCWTWPAGYFPADATYWADASGNNLDIYINPTFTSGQSDDRAPSHGSMGGGGGGATSSDIQTSSGVAAAKPQLPTAGGNGGDGIVIIRYKDPNKKKKRCADGLTI